MAVNKYPGDCAVCGNRVPARGGELRGSRRSGWKVYHLACAESGQSEVVEFYFPSTGSRVYRNARGRCEDSPCCGCCSA